MLNRKSSISNNKQGYRAFSLIETAVVIALFAILTTLSLPIGLNQLKKETTYSQSINLVSNIFVMQQNAYNGKESGEFGVYFTVDGYYIYEGLDYNSSTWSQYTAMEGSSNISSITLDNLGDEIHFTGGMLLPDTFGTITITDSNVNYNVAVNKEGVLDIERL